MKRFHLLIIILLGCTAGFTQDTLPRFTVTNAGANRNIVGWVNTYGLVKQISVQRSFDSLANFKTILTVADPNSRQNGLADRTRDSVSIGIKPGIPRRNDFIPSFYVYTNKDGYLFINLPDADKRKYHIKFYEEDDSFLFELKNIREPALTLDKTNFLHAGWFKFELYNEENLVEKNKFYLVKEF